MNDNRKMLMLLGLMALFAIGGFTYFALKIGALNVGDQKTYRLRFETAVGIPENADVRVYGIKVGSVTDLKLADKRGAWVYIGVEPSFPVYTDARAVVKAKSLLGERFIELQPGEGPDELPSGSEITDTVTPMRLEDIGEIFGPLVSNIDTEQLQLAFSTILDVIIENRDAIREGGRAFAQALTRMSELIDDEEDIQRLHAFLNSLTDLVIRFDRITRDNEELVGELLQNASMSMEDLQKLVRKLREFGDEFPEYKDDIETLLRSSARLLRDLEQVDGRKVGLILKKILQQEGLTFSVRGYSMKELRAQMDEYEKIATEGTDSVNPDCEPAMIRTGECKLSH
ncbi:MAG: MCE family protein [Candidatus Dadabacteria bacterium]|nr:MAG: MCE family protein [Candidatus Dadabacteria bacterium]